MLVALFPTAPTMPRPRQRHFLRQKRVQWSTRVAYQKPKGSDIAKNPRFCAPNKIPWLHWTPTKLAMKDGRTMLRYGHQLNLERSTLTSWTHQASLLEKR